MFAAPATDPASDGARLAVPVAPGAAMGARMSPVVAALLDSRQRWRDLAELALDFAFETDGHGRLTFLAPDPAVGWPASDLLGTDPARLLLRPDPDPFALRRPARGLRVWMRRPCGGLACLDVAVAPLTDPAGRFAGLRGTGRDVTAEVQEAEARAAALRRAETLAVLVRRIRREVLAPRMLAALLESLPATLGCVGAAVLEASASGVLTAPHRHGADPAPLLPGLPPLGTIDAPRYFTAPGHAPAALLPQPHRGAPQQALLVWRGPGERGFDADDQHLLGSLADLLAVTLGNQALQRELELQARTEALTGLPNRRAFLEDLRRRLERLRGDTPSGVGGDGWGGALLFLDLDNFKPINDGLGHEAGDAALVAVARLLRDAVRPVDLTARLGGDEFAVWLDGADTATALGRAEAICAAGRDVLAAVALPIGFSIGCAMARRGTRESAEALLARADAAMYAAKRAGRGRCVIAPEPTDG